MVIHFSYVTVVDKKPVDLREDATKEYYPNIYLLLSIKLTKLLKVKINTCDHIVRR